MDAYLGWGLIGVVLMLVVSMFMSAVKEKAAADSQNEVTRVLKMTQEQLLKERDKEGKHLRKLLGDMAETNVQIGIFARQAEQLFSDITDVQMNVQNIEIKAKLDSETAKTALKQMKQVIQQSVNLGINQ